jgi:hypothetical protein
MVRRTRPGISRFRVRCFASPRNDVSAAIPNMTSRPRGAAPELCIYLPPRTRAWGMPDARCTRGLVCNWCDRTHTSNNEYTGITRHSRTQWFYGLCRALPGDRALLPPSSAEQGFVTARLGQQSSANLTPASGRQDHTILPSAASSLVSTLGDRSHVFRPALQSRRTQNAAASTASAPRVRDDRDTPLWWGGMARICRDDLPDG